MEKFELIPGTINYAVSNYGNVINIRLISSVRHKEHRH